MTSVSPQIRLIFLQNLQDLDDELHEKSFNKNFKQIIVQINIRIQTVKMDKHYAT